MGILALIETRVPQNPVAESFTFPYPKNANQKLFVTILDNPENPIDCCTPHDIPSCCYSTTPFPNGFCVKPHQNLEKHRVLATGFSPKLGFNTPLTGLSHQPG